MRNKGVISNKHNAFRFYHRKIGEAQMLSACDFIYAHRYTHKVEIVLVCMNERQHYIVCARTGHDC